MAKFAVLHNDGTLSCLGPSIEAARQAITGVQNANRVVRINRIEAGTQDALKHDAARKAAVIDETENQRRADFIASERAIANELRAIALERIAARNG